jgi:LysR family transcriptional activator of nhaA
MVDMNWLNYHHLMYFWTVVRKGGLAPAAEELHLSPSTISTQIQQLEEVLGYKLFDRSGRQMTVNDVGQVVYRYAEEIFSLGRELQDALEDRPLERPMRVQIGIADVLSKMVIAKLLAPILGSLHTYKLICREDQPDNLVSQLILHDLDIVLTDKPIGPDLRVKGFNHLLGESEVAVYAAPSIVERYRSDFPESLNGAPCILPGDRSELRGLLEQWFESKGIRPKAVAECDDSALVKSLGKAKVGLFVAPSITKTEIMKQYNVREVGCLDGVVERYYAVSMDRRIKHPAVQAIVDHAKNSVFGDSSSLK